MHIPSNDERQMLLEKVQSDDETQVRVRFHHLANKYILQSENWDQRFGVIQIGSEHLQNPKAPTFEERSIEWTLTMEAKARKAGLFLHKSMYTASGSYS